MTLGGRELSQQSTIGDSQVKAFKTIFVYDKFHKREDVDLILSQWRKNTYKYEDDFKDKEALVQQWN